MTADEEKSNYEFNWVGNAANYLKQGCYDWMAAQLDDFKPKSVFDVGCGTGEGLSALRKRFGSRILAIDENSYCLRKAAALLRSDGAKVQLKERFHYVDQPNGRHIIGVDSRKIALSREIVLVQGDVLLADLELFRFIDSSSPFDAVTIWLLGTHKARESCMNLDEFDMPDISAYRFHVQNKVYELAARALRSGGVLQVVDRGKLLSDESDRELIMESHRVQASVTDLQVLRVASYPYDELTAGKRIRVVPASLTSARVPSSFAWGMISVLSRKP